MKHLKFIFIYFLIFLFTLFILGFSIQYKLLSLNKPISADILVIEGWLPSNILENIPNTIDLNKYKEILIVGLRHKVLELNDPAFPVKEFDEIELPFLMNINKILYMDYQYLSKQNIKDSIKNLTVYCSGTKAGNYYPYFSVFTDSILVGSEFAKSTFQGFTFPVNRLFSSIKSILIYFSNDIVIEELDRNLIIDSIALDKKILKSGFHEFAIKDLNSGYQYIPFYSGPGYAANYLKSIGVQRLTFLDTLYEGRNRTYIEAKKLNNYIKGKYSLFPSINIISMNGHSRRTYISYKTATGFDKSIGIISLENQYNDRTTIQEAKYRIGEYLKLGVSVFIYLIKMF